MKTTIIGANGFIGRHLLGRLKQLGEDCFTPERNDSSIFTKKLGQVIYCAGLTADYRQRPFDTVRAHVGFLSEILEKADFESFVYLSSTRVYYYSVDTQEDLPLLIHPIQSDDLFNASKLMGETLCLSIKRPNIRIARLSNVYGNDFNSNNFLFSIIKDAVQKKEIILQTTLDSEKDYVSVHNVVDILIEISIRGTSKIYNIASGVNVLNKAIVSEIQKVTHCNVAVQQNAIRIKFPPINIARIQKEFDYKPNYLQSSLGQLVVDYMNQSIL